MRHSEAISESHDSQPVDNRTIIRQARPGQARPGLLASCAEAEYDAVDRRSPMDPGATALGLVGPQSILH